MELINVAFGYVMKWCNDLVGNRYILALLLFALIFEILLLPFGIKQQKNSRKQAALRPKELAIRKKYNGRTDNASKQKMSMEIQEMYQQNGYNPMGGCLPMLIQFPIIIALLNIVYNPLRYICGLSEEAITAVIAKVNSFPEYADVVFNSKRNIDLMAAVKKIGPEAFSGIEGFSDKISSVADIPDLTMFGGKIDLAGVPSFTTPSWLLLIPVLTFVAYFFSMKINRKLMYQPAQNDAAMGCSNKVMDITMPLMSVFITFTVPAALGVYWILKCLIGVLKQFILSLAIPLKKTTDEDIKAAEKEYAEKEEKAPRRTTTGGEKRRSLHYIDDEEYEDVTNKSESKPETKAEIDAPATEEKAEKAEKNTLLAQAPLKEDAPREKNKKDKKED
jgi:YidC/Oxa1 family membrane protein insertase